MFVTNAPLNHTETLSHGRLPLHHHRRAFPSHRRQTHLQNFLRRPREHLAHARPRRRIALRLSGQVQRHAHLRVRARQALQRRLRVAVDRLVVRLRELLLVERADIRVVGAIVPGHVEEENDDGDVVRRFARRDCVSVLRYARARVMSSRQASSPERPREMKSFTTLMAVWKERLANNPSLPMIQNSTSAR